MFTQTMPGGPLLLSGFFPEDVVDGAGEADE